MALHWDVVIEGRRHSCGKPWGRLLEDDAGSTFFLLVVAGAVPVQHVPILKKRRRYILLAPHKNLCGKKLSSMC